MAFIGPNILVLQKNDGRVRRIINGVVQTDAALDVAVENSSERDCWGFALHPGFSMNHFVYFYLHAKWHGE